MTKTSYTAFCPICKMLVATKGDGNIIQPHQPDPKKSTPCPGSFTSAK